MLDRQDALQFDFYSYFPRPISSIKDTINIALMFNDPTPWGKHNILEGIKE
jgi:hypothetical protein